MTHDLRQQTWLTVPSPEPTGMQPQPLPTTGAHLAPDTNKVHSYRGIPTEVDEQMKAIAKELKVPVGEIARVLLEYALSAYQMGELMLNPQPRILRTERKNTLFPDA